MQQQHLINFLNQLLSNQFVLYVKLHRYRWFVEGQHFFQLHHLFETLYEETAGHIDKAAERILAIEGKPLATMAKFLKESTIEEAAADDTETEIVQHLQTDYETLVKEIQETGIPLVLEQSNEPARELLASLQQTYEKHIWQLKAYQKKI